jgi:hypothetical protein
LANEKAAEKEVKYKEEAAAVIARKKEAEQQVLQRNRADMTVKMA